MKIALNSIVFLLLPLFLYAHTVEINLKDNKDGTLNINGEFDTGESIAGALVQLKALGSGEVLYETRFPSNNQLILEIPKIPYQIILVDEADGDETIKDGIPPPGGFVKSTQSKPATTKEETVDRKSMQISSSKAVTFSIVLAFILLFATLFISIKNTHKLMDELKSK